jgi:hypothetical protein
MGHGKGRVETFTQMLKDAQVRDAWAEKAREYEFELDGDPQNLHGQGRTFGLRAELRTLRGLVEALPSLRYDEIDAVDEALRDGGCDDCRRPIDALLIYRATLAGKGLA